MQVLHWCVSGRLAMARLCPDAFPGTRRWQNAREMRSPASDGGNILARCVPGRFAVARFRRDAFPGGNPWQFFHSMYPKRGLGRENRQFLPGRGPFRCTDPSNHAWGANLAIPRAAEPLQLPQLCRLRTARALAAPCAAEQRERLQPRRRPYGRRNGARAASCRAG